MITDQREEAIKDTMFAIHCKQLQKNIGSKIFSSPVKRTGEKK